MRFRKEKKDTDREGERERKVARRRVREDYKKERQIFLAPELVAWNNIIPDFYGRCFS